MESTLKILCPVCNRPHVKKEQCPFCGADLQAIQASLTGPEGQVFSPEDLSSIPPSNIQTGYSDDIESSLPPSATASVRMPQFAGFWIRLVAFIIDSLLVGLLFLVLVGAGIFGYISGSDSDVLNELMSDPFGINLNFYNGIFFTLNIAYFSFFLSRSGQTPGKMICGLKVIRVDGGPLGIGQAVLRTLGYYLNEITLFIGFFWVAIDQKKQGLHDKIAGTYEIRLRFS